MKKDTSATVSLFSINTTKDRLMWLLVFSSAILLTLLLIQPIKEKINSFNQHYFSPEPANKLILPVATTSMNTSQSVNDIVNDALAFYNMLSTANQNSLQLNYTTTLARKWSNLPCGSNCRNGLQLGTNLSSAQYAAAMQIIKDALSATSNDGYDEFHQMNLAEAYLHANGGGNNYDSTLRWMAFLNTPTTTGAWMLQFGGHHYAANIAFKNGHVIGATPFFMGLEPKTFTYNTVSYDPLGEERDAFRALLSSFSSAQLSTALISSSFSDCVMIPGESNGGASSFPSVTIGQACSSLTTTQQNLVMNVLQHYVGDMDSATSATVLDGYANEISQTYVSYHGGGTSGNPTSFLAAQGDYARISGPHAWIEFSCQGGIVIQGQIHYHTVWRDRSHDYGVDLSGAAIDSSGTTGIPEARWKSKLTIYPNPSNADITISFPQTLSHANVSIADMNGHVVYTDSDFNGEKLNISVSTFTKGNYIVNARTASGNFSGRFLKQ